MILYDYLIVYSAHTKKEGVDQSVNGMVNVIRSNKIDSMKEVISVKEYLEEEYNMTNLIIVNYKLLREGEIDEKEKLS